MKKHLLSILVLLISAQVFAQKTFDFKKYQHQNRLLFYFAPDTHNETVIHQISVFEQKKSAIEARKLAVITVFKDGGWDENGNRITPEQADQLRIKYGIRHPFTFVLVGKDGYEKYRNNEMLDIEDIFRRIDTMPLSETGNKN
jgi:hypothetical protein